MNAVSITPRTLKPALYRSLRRLGFSRSDCLRALWHGADMDIVSDTPAPCDHDWSVYEGPGRGYTGWLERCEKCGDIMQVIQ